MAEKETKKTTIKEKNTERLIFFAIFGHSRHEQISHSIEYCIIVAWCDVDFTVLADREYSLPMGISSSAYAPSKHRNSRISMKAKLMTPLTHEFHSQIPLISPFHVVIGVYLFDS